MAPEALRLRARQEIKNMELRLRLRAVERGGDAGTLWRGMMASLPKIAVTLETLLRTGGVAVPPDRPGLLRLAAREMGIPEERMEPFTPLHRTDPQPDDATVRRLYGEYLELLAAISRRVEERGGMTNPLDLRGPEFLAFYLAWGLAVFIWLGFSVRAGTGPTRLPSGHVWRPGIYPAEGDAYTIALLRGGPEEVALADLRPAGGGGFPRPGRWRATCPAQEAARCRVYSRSKRRRSPPSPLRATA